MRPTTPKDAASLALVQRDRSDPRVLMGRRPASSSFVPDAYVFPGGKVDPGDARVRSEFGLEPEVQALLRRRSANSLARAAAIACAAVRETYEETGLLVARPGSFAAPDLAAWRDFRALGLAPDLTPLRLLGRAITPTQSPVRYHARFLIADARCLRGTLRASSELEDLRWLPFEEARQLPMLDVTAVLLEQAERWALEDERPSRRTVVFVRYRGDSLVVQHEAGGP